jgi:isoleucyl-tRNA synthetase
MIITHGFVVDEHGAKMSKSIGNVIMPSQLLGPSSIDAPTNSKGADGEHAPAATTTTASAAATGAQDGAKSRAPPALDAALDAAALSALEAQIGAQGILVRELKVAAKGGASKKAEVDAAVAALVALKAKLPVEATAAAPRAEGAAPNHKKLQKEARKARDDRAPYGVDVLRLWVATADWKGDVALGDAVLERSRDIYRRLRNACRFCLGNLYDFDESVDALPLEQLRLGDRHMLHTLAEHTRVVQASYDAYELNRVVAATLALATERLSAEYFHATKDRLYCGHATGASRRAVQTVLHASLDTILLSIGPIAPFLVEEVHEHRAQPRPPPPIDRTWGEPPAAWHQPKLARQWALARLVEEQVTLVLHEARVDKRIAGGGEALVELQTAPGSELHAALEYLGPELNDLLGVSATRLTALTSGESAASAVVDVHELVCSYDGMLKAQVPLQHEHALRIWVRKTTAPKCPRCWRHVPTAAVLEEAESARLDDGWLYRGCPGFGQAGCLKEAAQVGS